MNSFEKKINTLLKDAPIDKSLGLWNYFDRELTKLVEDNKRERKVLENVVDLYTGLVNSGDCGNWDPEEADDIVEARVLLNAR